MSFTAIALIDGRDAPVLELALKLGETTALAVGPPDLDQPLADALAAGAVRAVRLWEAALEDVDYLGVALGLAAVTQKLAATTGQVLVSGDRGRAAVGPAVAERLGMPHLCNVVDAAADGDRLKVRRRGDGVLRLYAAVPPIVLCAVLAVDSSPKARLAGGKARAARGKARPPALPEVEVWSLAQAGLTAGQVSYRRHFRAQPEPGPTQAPRLFGSAEELARRLRADGLLSAPGAGQ